jgi:ribonuclease VapC
MIIDASVLLAILFHESNYEAHLLFLHQQAKLFVPSPIYHEAAVVYGRRHGFYADIVRELLQDIQAEILAFNEEHARQARLAYGRFGKGQGHPAQLNYADCMSYAVAVTENQTLLYIGEDFKQTDIQGIQLA